MRLKAAPAFCNEMDHSLTPFPDRQLCDDRRIVAAGAKHRGSTANAVRAVVSGAVQQSERKFLVGQNGLRHQLPLRFIALPVVATAPLNRQRPEVFRQ